MLVGPPAASAAPYDTRLASRGDGAGGLPFPGSTLPLDLSADGRYALFIANGHLHVRDVHGATTELIDRASGAAGAIGDGAPGLARITPDGRYVAFTSTARNLVAPGLGGCFPQVFCNQVYRRDRETDQTILVSRAP